MAGTQPLSIDLDGAEVPLRVHRDRRARRLILRLDPHDDALSLVLPRGVSLAEGLRFAAEKTVWIRARLAALPPRVLFADGAVVPFLGADHRVRHRRDARGTVWRAAGEIHVAGRAEHLARRLGDWLRREARAELVRRARDKSARVGRRPGRVTVRESRSRWGSCSTDGNLNFSWRLILAPEPVLDYVVAHEVAHLVEMNHSPAFWAVVERLTADADGARAWLRRHGERLYRYG